jgi:serine/threonine-protein kinase
MKQGQRDEAFAEYREAIRLNRFYQAPHINLGIALREDGRLDDAIAEFREVIRWNLHNYLARFHLGVALTRKGQLNEAIAEYREVIRLNKDFAPAHDELAWAQKLAQLLDRLPAVLEGKAPPTDASEYLAFAEVCQQPFFQRNASAVRFYEEAFVAEPKLADDLQRQPRYNAACAAALAGCGQGKDAGGLPDKEYVGLRRQALEWLRADLTVYRQDLERVPDKVGPVVRERLQHWQQDTDFAGVRGPEALTKLPELERQQWQQLWLDVAVTLARAEGKASPEKKTAPK